MDDPTSPPTPTSPTSQGSQGPAGARTSDPQPTPDTQPTPTSQNPAGVPTPPTPTSQGPAGAPTPTSPDPRGPAGALTPPTPGSQGPAGSRTHPDARRSRLGTVVAVAVALTGAVWLLQGLGVLTAGGSFMTGDPTWAVVGVVFIVGGVLLGAWTRRRAAPTS